MSKSTAARAGKRGSGPPVSVAIRNGVAWLRLARAEAANRISAAVAQELCRAAEAIELDDGVTAVVLETAGPTFCAGVEDAGAWEDEFDWVRAIGQLTPPVIAAIQGDAIAEGLELALACDLRVVSGGARFAMSQLRAGYLPRHGGTQRLPRLIGRTRALELLLTGRVVDAAEAQAIGLATRVVPAHGLAGAVAQLLTTLGDKGPLALRYAKEAVLKGSDLTLGQGIRLEEDLYVLLQTTRDRHEGIRAFLEKRRPQFRGH